MKTCPSCGSRSVSVNTSSQTVIVNGQTEQTTQTSMKCMDCGYSESNGGEGVNALGSEPFSEMNERFDSFVERSQASTSQNSSQRKRHQPKKHYGTKSMGPIAKLFFFLLFLALAVGSYFGVDYLNKLKDGSSKKYEDPSGYQPVEAMIVGQTQDPSYMNPETPASSIKKYLLRIKYQYQVDGQTYTGDRYSVNNPYHTCILFTEHNSALNQYRIGKKLTVYYNPKKPFVSVISKQMPYQPRIEPYISPWYPAVFLFCIAILCLPGVFPTLEKAFNRLQYGR